MPSTDDYDGSGGIVPVFVVDKISTKTIDRFLDALRERRITENYSEQFLTNVLVLDSDDRKTIHENSRPSRSPIPETFSSPFIGLSGKGEELRDLYKKFFRDKQSQWPFSNNLFLVLDKRSEEDDTCAILSTFELDGEARAEFAIATEVTGPVDVGSHCLNEGYDAKDLKDSRYDGKVLGAGNLHTVELFDRKNHPRKVE